MCDTSLIDLITAITPTINRHNIICTFRVSGRKMVFHFGQICRLQPDSCPNTSSAVLTLMQVQQSIVSVLKIILQLDSLCSNLMAEMVAVTRIEEFGEGNQEGSQRGNEIEIMLQSSEQQLAEQQTWDQALVRFVSTF